MENNNKLEALKKASEELYQSFVKMNKAWSDFDENLEFDDYPFDINFPELINNVKEWNDEVNSLLHIDNNQMQKTKLSFEEFQNQMRIQADLLMRIYLYPLDLLFPALSIDFEILQKII